MTNKGYEEELVVRIITDYLKEEKNIEIKNVAHVKTVCNRNRGFVGVGFPNPHDESLRFCF